MPKSQNTYKKSKGNRKRQDYSNKRTKKGRTRGKYSSKSRYNKRFRANETIDDIKTDIARIEKEIKLELKEIRSTKLGI